MNFIAKNATKLYIQFNPSPSYGREIQTRKGVTEMKIGDKLQVVQDDNGKTILYFVSADNKSHKNFSIGDAVEAIKYLLWDEEGRKAKDAQD